MTEKIYEDGKELGVYEARIINKNYSDDTWQLTGYTSEVRNNDGSFFAFIDFNANGEGVIRECPHCLEYEIHNKLGPKIKKKDGPVAPDDENWLQCWECGGIYAIYQTYPESEIKDSLQTVSNPFEGNESIFLAIETRKEQRKKGKKRKGRFSYKQENQDPDIQTEIDRHGYDNVRIIQ